MANAKALPTGVVEIHGRQYKTVALRLNEFRQTHPAEEGWTFRSEVIYSDEERVIVKAEIMHNAQVLSTGHGEEYRGASNINKTSALEVAETSAFGRALAFFAGEYAGTEIASADEVANAINQQREFELAEMNTIARENFASIAAIKAQISLFMETGDMQHLELAAEAYAEMDNEAKTKLWVAPSKGGLWETHERKIMHSDEWKQARESVFEEENNG